MSTILPNDATKATVPQSSHQQFKKIPLDSFKTEKVTSLDDLKSRNIDFRTLQPAVLMNGALWVQPQSQRQ